MGYCFNRRRFIQSLAMSSAVGVSGLALSSIAKSDERLDKNRGLSHPVSLDANKINIGIFVYPTVTMLDAYAPLQVLVASQQFNVFTFSETGGRVPSDANVDLLPNYGFDNCPDIEVLIVPGSANPIGQMTEPNVLSFLKRVGKQAKYITSVCTGALILAEAGLLDGYTTTVHWAYAEVLKKYPHVTYVDQRIVKDRNRISGGGITAGLDFAITLVAELADTYQAQALELILEYDPQPPFKTGNHNSVSKELKQVVQGKVHALAKDLFI
ncbi:DJ-1/PfpI family protein [Vibrio ostreicida]|uniref:DJ-1/PfpI family protein n=1 Tax=Vibrio ostreicida TaxID=526588 RepID=UPI003B5CB403